MAYWGRDDEPMYYDDGRPANESAEHEGPPDWAPEHVRDRYDWEQEQIKRWKEKKWQESK